MTKRKDTPMTVGGNFGTGAYMSYTTDQLRKDNALGEYALSEEEEAVKIIQAPAAPQATAPASADSGVE